MTDFECKSNNVYGFADSSKLTGTYFRCGTRTYQQFNASTMEWYTVTTSYRGVLSVDFTDQATAVTSAYFKLRIIDVVDSPDEVYKLYEATTQPPTAYNQYDSGTMLGYIDSDGQEEGFVTITLNDDGITYLNDNLGEGTVSFFLVSTTYAEDAGYIEFASPEHSSADWRPVLITDTTAPSSATIAWTEDVEVSPSYAHYRGSTAVFRAYITDGADEPSPINADACVISIKPKGATSWTVDEASMENTDTGVYDYFYDIPSDATLGEWVALIKETYDDGGTDRYVLITTGFKVRS
jgi:hypothetical protein